MLTAVVGGQAGSEGKGAICAALHHRHRFTHAVRVGGPNAGHTVIGDDGIAWALRQLPVAAVADPSCMLVIAAGSEIDPTVLVDEVVQLDQKYKVADRLFIDMHATLVDEQSKYLETDIQTGTTGKGIGGARARRALRIASLVKDERNRLGGLRIIDTQRLLRSIEPSSILIEGTQGYILGSHAGHYPHATSGNCRAVDFLAMTGLPPQPIYVINTLRYNPIRIAGNSGYLLNETTWEELGLDAELTTVTKKIRRVGAWNPEWAAASCDANKGPGGCELALTFMDYPYPILHAKAGIAKAQSQMQLEFPAQIALPDGCWAFLRAVQADTGCRVRFLGTGPDSVIELV